MGEKISITVGGQKVDGWLAKPTSVKGPAVIVIQEWWGLVPHIQDVTDRFAKEGFVAFAPDLYHGKTTTSPDEAGRLLMELDIERVGREITAAGAYLLALPECSSKTFGVVGFCMGGALAQYAATSNASVGAAVSFYGGFKKVPLRWENLSCPILLIYGEMDEGVPASGAKPLEDKVKALGKKIETIIFRGASHAFFNDTRPGVYSEECAKDAWLRTLAHLRENLV